MKIAHKSRWLSLVLGLSLVLAGMMPVVQAQIKTIQSVLDEQEFDDLERDRSFDQAMQEARGAEFLALLQRVLGDGADAAKDAIEDDDEALFQAVDAALNEKVDQRFEDRVKPLRRTPKEEASLVRNRKYLAFAGFGLRLVADEAAPDAPKVEVKQTDKEVSASGSTTKKVEVEGGTVTRTNKVETKAINDGLNIGVEYKTTEIVEAKSKTENKGFRKETIVNWRVEIAACPDVNGVVAGTGTETVSSKNLIADAGGTIEVSREITIQMQMKGYVNDEAEMTHYEVDGEVVEKNSGFDRALQRGLLKEATHKDGTNRVGYMFKGNKAGTSDSTDRGIEKTPAEKGKISIKPGEGTSLESAKNLDSKSGKLIGAIWNEANNSYQRARSHWRNYGCVEVNCTAPKTKLKLGEEIRVSAEAIHQQDKTPVNSTLKATASEGVTPEEQKGLKANFVVTAPDAANGQAHIVVESFSKRGIGIGGIDFSLDEEPDEVACDAGWTGTLTVQRKMREEREKRAGDNLAENGGYLESATKAELKLNGKRDTKEDATIVYFGRVTGSQEEVDYEYDKYKVDEGFCGPNATPYKAPLEKTRTSKTTAQLNHRVRYLMEVDKTSGSISFSLPEVNGTTVHSYVHKSACPENDRANTNKATDHGTSLTGNGEFSITFPVKPEQQNVTGTVTTRGDDGSTTTYSWNLVRCTPTRPPAKAKQ